VTESHDNRVILLGLDGATFQLLSPLIAEGVLPNLGSMRRDGSSGVLDSTVPPSTGPAWVSCVTGVNPGKHGIFDFRAPLNAENRRTLVSSRLIKVEKIWTILNRHGKRAGIINLPVSYPPEPLQGFMISGMMTPGPDVSYTYPGSLKTRLGDYIIDLKAHTYEITSVSDAERFLQDALTMFDRRWKVFLRLMDEEDWDFLMPVFVVLDRIQHRLWKYLDLRSDLAHTPDGQSVRDAAIKVFYHVDERLGELVSNLPADTSLIIVSDHGFGPIEAFFNVNSWLADQGMLTIQTSKHFNARLFQAAAAFSAKPAVRRLFPRSLDRRIRERIRRQRTLFKHSIEDKINWEASQAYFPSNLEQAIYLISPQDDGVGKMQDYRDRVVNGLLSLTMPRDGKPVVDEIYTREDIFCGSWADKAAPIYINCRNYAVLGNARLGRSEWFTYLDDDPSGFHQPDGIFVGIGPSFERGKTLPASNITDVTPTVLYAMGLPIPDYMDGKVMSDAFTPAFRKHHSVLWKSSASESLTESVPACFSEEETGLIEERLRALGYLD
jgi:predicted AlkP superfamily phosphohydrolase/phosphomutase